MFSLSGRLYKFDQVPKEFNEHGIIFGYRNPKSSFHECVWSIFTATNETLNFWTHFIAVWYFAWRLVVIHNQVVFDGDSYKWPLLVFLICCCIYPLGSAFAHAFNTMSIKARHICFYVDYAVLSCYTLGAALVYRAYVFPKALLNSPFSDWYVYIAFVNAVACTFVSCHTRTMKPGIWNKVFRLGAFAVPYIFDTLPLLYRILFCEEEQSYPSHLYHCRQFLFAGVAALLYSTHMPERLLPGTFDIIGHSHQLFHVMAVLGTNDQLEANLLDMVNRKEYIVEHSNTAVFEWSLIALGALIVINCMTIYIHAKQLENHPSIKSNNNEKEHCH